MSTSSPAVRSANSSRVVIMAGGTGGHIFPALAIANSLRNYGVDVVCLGTMHGMENVIVPKTGFKLYRIHAAQIDKGKPLKSLWSMVRMGFAFAEVIKLFRCIKPQLIISTGSFVSAPGGVVAWLLKIPLVIHEQNAVPGITNRWLAHLANHTMQAFPDVFSNKYNPQLVGNPIRQEILAIAAPEIRYKNRTGNLRILVIGGSQGALMLNRLLPCVFKKLNMPLDIWHQTGQKSLKLTQNFYKRFNIPAKIEDFIINMAEAYAWADMIICRSGALTVSELCVAGLPALFIPFPYAVHNHQLANTQQMVRAGAAICVEQKQATVLHTSELLQKWFARTDARALLMEKAKIARKLAFPKASEAIAQICMAIMNEKSRSKSDC